MYGWYYWKRNAFNTRVYKTFMLRNAVRMTAPHANTYTPPRSTLAYHIYPYMCNEYTSWFLCRISKYSDYHAMRSVQHEYTKSIHFNQMNIFNRNFYFYFICIEYGFPMFASALCTSHSLEYVVTLKYTSIVTCGCMLNTIHFVMIRFFSRIDRNVGGRWDV